METEIVAKNNELEYLKEKTIPREEYVSLQNKLETEIVAKDKELEYLKEKTIPREDYISLQTELQGEINSKDSELKYLREQTIPKEDYIKLQNELNRKNDKIKRLEEINTFFNELQEEQEAYETMDSTPPFRLEKKQGR